MNPSSKIFVLLNREHITLVKEMNDADLKKVQIKVNIIIPIELIEYYSSVRFNKKTEIIRFKPNPLAHNLHKLLVVNLYLNCMSSLPLFGEEGEEA